MSLLSIEAIIDRYTLKSKKAGVELEVLLETSKSFSASYQKGQLDPFKSEHSHALGFRIIKGECEISTFSESLDQADLDLVFEQALGSVEFFKKSYTPKFVTSEEYEPMGFLYNENAYKVSIDQKLEQSKLIEKSAMEVDEKIQSVPYQSFGDYESEFFIYNTNGVRATYKSNGFFGYAFALAKGAKDTRTAYEVASDVEFEKINMSQVAKKAATEAVSKLNAVTPKTGTYAVMFNPHMAQQLLGLLQGSFYADKVDKNLSIFCNKLGESVASSLIEITDDPFLKKSQHSRPFDSEGASSKKTTLIKKGQLSAYLTNSVYAKKLGVENTANASRGAKTSLGIGFSNMVLTPGQESFEELVSKNNQTIVIDVLQGLHSGYNSISGDFSLQAEGFMYESGHKKQSLANFVISGNIIQMLKDVQAVGSDVLIAESRVISPSFLVSALSVAGESN